MKKKTKSSPPRKTFAERLAGKLCALNKGIVDTGGLGDGSGTWVNITIDRHKLEFGFDTKGETLTGFILVREVYAKVDEEKIFGV